MTIKSRRGLGSEDEEMGFWYRRTRLEKALIVSITITALLAIGLMVGLIVVKLRDPDAIVCKSAECLIAAAHLQNSLDLTVDPCDDFYEFACGGWMKNNIIGPDRSRWSQFDVTRKVLLDKLRVLLDGDINKDYPDIIGHSIEFYKKCTNMTKRDSEGYDVLTQLLKEIDWPMLNQGNLNNNDYDWTKVYARLNREISLSAIFNNYVYLDAKNTTLYSIHVDAPSFGVGRLQLVEPDKPNNKKILEAYEQFIKSVVTLLANETYDGLENDIKQLIEFEKKLANITADSASRRDRHNLYGNKTNIQGFATEYGQTIPLLQIEKDVFVEVTDGQISETSPLIVYDRAYFERVGDILKNTAAKTIANYLGWRTVKSLGSYTTKAFRDIEFAYNRVVSGATEPRPIWEECIDATNNRLTFAVGRLYVDNNFPESAKTDMNIMIDQLNIAFTELLDENTWMQSETKEKAREKLKEMLRSIGFPDFIKNDTQLIEYYNKLDLKPDSTYLSSVVTISKWSNLRSLSKLNTVNTNRSELEWSTGPAIVNAFFSPNINRITFPAGILQAPFYTLGLPVSLNLGAIGVVIGHEITHSFDDSGSQYDKYGNLYNWWDPITKAEFKQRVKCFVDQYSSYNDSLAGIPVNGSTTIGENIADNGGLRQAFRALEHYPGTKQILPTSMRTFTNEQLFFLSFANVWCTNIRREALINQIETDPHSPGKYRVWGSVSNSEAFANAFNCKADTNMNRKNKCILW